MTSKQRRLPLGMLALLMLAVLLYSLSYERGMLVATHYITPMTALFLGLYLPGANLKQSRVYLAGLLVPVWFVVSRMLGGELYLDESFLPFSHLLYMYGMALPFARLTGDGLRRTGLQIVSLLLFACFGAVAWAGVAAAVTQQTIVLPGLGTNIWIHPSEMRLYMGSHANTSAAQMLAALLMGVWAVFSLRKKWLIPIAAVLGLGLYLGIGLTVSRTVMLQAGAALGGVIFCLILHNRPKKPLRIAAAIAAAVVCVAGVYMSFDPAVQAVTSVPAAVAEETTAVIAERPLTDEWMDMNGRTGIYKGILRLLGEKPDVLLRGMHNNDLVKTCRAYTPNKANHAHNAYLQTILLMGLPGVAVAVWLTVRLLVRAWRMVFGAGFSLSDKALAVIACALLINAITECFLFTEQQVLYNFMFLLLTGYVLETVPQQKNA